MPTVIMLVFAITLLVLLLFIVRLVCAPFSSKVSDQILKHPIIHVIWACFAVVGFLVYFEALNPAA